LMVPSCLQFFECHSPFTMSFGQACSFESTNQPPHVPKISNLCPLPTKARSYMFTIKKHNSFQTRYVSNESPEYIASRWKLFWYSKLLCISIAIRVMSLCTQEDVAKSPRYVGPPWSVSFHVGSIDFSHDTNCSYNGLFNILLII
jgi:hypothetical protein